jgi:hypothetical protein
MRLRHVQQHGVVHGLGALFDDVHIAPRIERRRLQHQVISTPPVRSIFKARRFNSL